MTSGSYFLLKNADDIMNEKNIEMLTRDTPDFIPPTLWPPISPDLNPVDYKVRSAMQERA